MTIGVRERRGRLEQTHRVQCPTCRKRGMESEVFEDKPLLAPSFTRAFYDSAGLWHPPRNITYLKCTRGHAFRRTSKEQTVHLVGKAAETS
jgi:hypothetical protein